MVLCKKITFHVFNWLQEIITYCNAKFSWESLVLNRFPSSFTTYNDQQIFWPSIYGIMSLFVPDVVST